MSQATRARRSAIKGYLSGTPATIKDLTVMFNLSYHTLRNDISALQEAGDIHIVGQAQGGSALYSTNSSRVDTQDWPQVYKGPYGEWNFAQAVAMMSGTRGFDEGVKALFAANRVIFEIMAFVPDDEVTNSQLSKVRTQYLKFIEAVEAHIRMHKLIYKDNQYWTKQGLQEMRVLPGTPELSAIRTYQEKVHNGALAEFHKYAEQLAEFGKDKPQPQRAEDTRKKILIRSSNGISQYVYEGTSEYDAALKKQTKPTQTKDNSHETSQAQEEPRPELPAPVNNPGSPIVQSNLYPDSDVII